MTPSHGYAGNILRVDLTSGETTRLPTMDQADRFVGGRGIAAKIYWDEVLPHVGAFDPENRLLFMTGPMAAVSGVAGPRWLICGKAPGVHDPDDRRPELGQFRDCSLGGKWGVQLKSAGYDGLIIQGKAGKTVYLLIHDGLVEIRDAAHLWGKGAREVREILKSELGSSVSVVSIGPAGENMVSFANLLAENDASGSGGLGAVMGSKKLKAIVVAGSRKVTVADPDRFKQLTRHVRELNHEFLIAQDVGLTPRPNMKKDYCYGCPGGCFRATLQAGDGQIGKYMCHSALFYEGVARKYHGELNDIPFYANRLSDEYGLDTYVVQPMLIWLSRCYREGILTEENTGIPLSKMGSLELIETLVRKIALRDGFGDALAQGLTSAASLVGSKAKELLDGYIMRGRVLANDPRAYVTTALLFATEPRPSQSGSMRIMAPYWHWTHCQRERDDAGVTGEVLREVGRRFFGGELAYDLSTYSGKALAATKTQDRAYVNESLILCALAWPLTIAKGSSDHVGDPSLESKLFSAVTGRDSDEDSLHRIGETIFNVERAILAREGRGNRQSDTLPEYVFSRPLPTLPPPHDPECKVPGKDGEVVSRKGAVLDRAGFEQMKDEYYQLRRWDVATGRQTKAQLEELGLADVAVDLERRGLLAAS